jgi:hypothetical protein
MCDKKRLVEPARIGLHRYDKTRIGPYPGISQQGAELDKPANGIWSDLPTSTTCIRRYFKILLGCHFKFLIFQF